MLRWRVIPVVLAVSLLAAACSDSASTSDGASAAPDDPAAATGSEDETGADGEPGAGTGSELPTGSVRDFGPAPEVPTGDLAPDTRAAVEAALGDSLRAGEFGPEAFEAIRTLGASGDPRVAWWLTDLLRITRSPDLAAIVGGAYTELTGVGLDPFAGWGDAVDHLLAWDVPPPPDYLTYKRNVYLVVEPRWDPLFAAESDVDWRLVSWGGVLIDDRPYDETDVPCNCIPAADNPRTTDVAGGDAWLEDDTIVFGVEIDGEARAYPRSIMEVREMVNDTLGGRDFAMPYCTLCGAAQVFFTDEVEGFERPVLRTSGLLSRSNKVMYDVRTESVFDTFLGAAVSGPLWEAGVVLPQNSVVTTTWGQWKAEHPDTTVLHIEEALGRPESDLRNTRDADGPIFPIGAVDPRLPVQEDVLGLFTADGEPIAFHVTSAVEALERGETVSVGGINLILDGGGVRAVDGDGTDLGGHQAFWFAWSQFHPETALWPER